MQSVLRGAIAFSLALWLQAADPVRDERWRQDLRFLATELPQRHANWYAAVERARFESAVAELDRAIPDLSDADVIVGMARAVALGRDAHTSILLPQNAAPFRPVGLQFYWFPEGLFVTATSRDLSRALGTRVVRIGDAEVDRAYQAVSTVISSENDYWVRELSPRYLALPEVLRALRLAPETATVRYTFEDSRGERFTLEAAPQAVSLPRPDPAEGFTPLYRRNTGVNYWFQYLEDARTLYFKYNLARDIPNFPFSEFARQMFSAMDANPVERLVFDVRNNPGGNSAVIEPFFQGMGERISRLRAFVLTNRGTASSGMRAALAGQGTPNVLLLGEPTGGKPNAFGDRREFSLPNSGLVVGYSIQRFTVRGQEGDALFPDLGVPLSAADYFARHDPVLAAALAWRADGAAPTSPPVSGSLAVVNAAGFRAGLPVAPGALASAFGAFRGVSAADATSLPLARRLGGVEVRINGVAAPLLAVRALQINFQAPFAAAVGAARVEVILNGETIAEGWMQVAASAPGLFALDPFDLSQPGAVLNQDSSLHGRTSRARRGEVIQIFGTGAGVFTPAVGDGTPGRADPLSRTPELPQVFIGAEPAEVLFSGASTEFPGLWQINARVPARPALAGQTPVFVVIAGVASNAVTLWLAP